MDSQQLTLLKSEINALPTFLSTYDTGVANFLNGTNPTCPHFLDTIDSLKNDISLSVAYDGAWSGQGASYGVISDFVYTVSAIKRSKALLTTYKSAYYSGNDSEIITSNNYYSGEAAKIISYLLGKSPDQHITI